MKLSKTYTPQEVEANIYALWEQSDAFAPSGKGKSFSIVMPPPNANGNLHAGHAMYVLQDILIRYHRMQGYDTVWIPGADHAGFETWVVFEKNLTEQGKSRFDYSRDELYQMTWDFVAENRGNMKMQLRALGASCDWNHNVFTLDKGVIDVVFTTFKKLWDDGLVYRGERIVNYCTQHDTSFADIEVEYREEQGKLWYIDYPLASGQGSVTVATTRPETMLGDEAVAVNPSDKRYAKLVGQKVILPLVDKEIPIIADEAVEHEFGTGAVKVTPAHDPTDFEIGQRHKLPISSVIGFDGHMVAPAPAEYVGLGVDEARAKVVVDLETQGLISKVEDFTHQVPYCYKCGTAIQPLVKDQWFVSVQPLAKKAIAAIKQGKIGFTPKQKGKELVRYYEELKDWNISRQIPWGIPIPAFRRVSDAACGVAGCDAQSTHQKCAPPCASSSALHSIASNSPDKPEWIFDTRVSEKEIEVGGKRYIRDEDTFDTWFSSGQWPYITTHVRPDGSESDLKRFYPTSVMETGFDIFRAWVARMVMLGLYISGEVPFKDVYLHGLVNDEHNQKMSKSKGNVINPMTIVDEYGSDALRMGIIANRSAAQSQAFSTATVVAGRNFCNKLWNIARFVDSTNQNKELSSKNKAEPQSIADNWVIYKLNRAKKQIEQHINKYRFAEAYETLYHVVWDDVADWYLEAAKLPERNSYVLILNSVLDYCLKLAHPFAPFVTEAIWQSIHSDVKSTTMLISQQWPEEVKAKKVDFDDFERIKSVVTECRNLQAELGNGKRKLIVADNGLIVENADLVKHLARLEEIVVGRQGQGIRLTSAKAWLSASNGEITEHYAKLQEKLDKIQGGIKKLEARLANKSYVKSAPKELVEETKQELERNQKLAEQIATELAQSK